MDVKLEEEAKRRADFCSIFSNANRVLILWTLAKSEMSVTEIASAINSSLQNTSQHLSLMKAQKILASRRDGQTIYYRVETNHAKNFCFLMHQIHDRQPAQEA